MPDPSDWHLVAMTATYAEELLAWEYPEPFQRYSMLDERAADFTDPANGYLALVDAAGELVGFRSFGPDGQVPGGTYDDTALDTGGGLRPDLTGRGMGRTAIQVGIDYAWATFDTARLRVTVWAENERALKVVRALGFEAVDRFKATTTHEDYLILTLPRPQRGGR
jgi:ribosomal-protein-alanine N-acetyltransferase